MSILTIFVGAVLLTVVGVTAVSVWLVVKAWRAGRKAYHSLMDKPSTSYDATRPRSGYGGAYSPYTKDKESDSGSSLAGYAAAAGAGLLAGSLLDRSSDSSSGGSSSSSGSSSSCASIGGSDFGGGDSGGGGSSGNSCASSSSCSSSSSCGGSSGCGGGGGD